MVRESTVDKLGLDKDSSITGVDIYIEKGGMIYAEFKIVIRFCLIIKGWERYN